MSGKRQYTNLFIFVFFLAITSVFFRPLLQKFSFSVIDDYDGLLITWSLNRVARNFPDFAKIISGNIFYPYPYSHAYSDPFLTDGLISWPFLKIFNEPVAAFNANLLVSQVLLLFFTYLFFSTISSNLILNILLSLVFGFSLIRFHFLQHLQMFSLYWIPLAGYCLLKFAKSQKVIFLSLFFLAFLAQTLNSFLPGYFLIFLFFCFYLGQSDLRRVIQEKYFPFLAGGLIVFFIIFPLIRVYFFVSSYFNYVRPIKDAVHFSLSAEELLTKFFDPLLLIFGFCLFLAFRQKKRLETGNPFLFAAVIGYLLSLGPALHFLGRLVRFGSLVIPLPYAFFYYFVAGFKGFRTPLRWIFLFAFGASAFSTITLDHFLKAKSKRIRYLVFVLIIFLLAVFVKPPQNYIEIPRQSDYPEVYSWLKNQPGQTVIELPIYYWGDFQFGKREAYRMLYSLFHQKKMVNGYSGFSPPAWEELVVNLRKEFPSEATLAKIKGLGIDYLVVHLDEFVDQWPEDFSKRISFLEKSELLKEDYRKDNDLVYVFSKNN